MAMRRYFGLKQVDVWFAAALSQKALRKCAALPLMDGSRAAEIRQRKGRFPVTAVKGAEQREQRGVLRNRQQLAVAGRPTRGCKVAGENPDFGDEWVRHDNLYCCGKMPNKEMMKLTHRN